MIRTDELRGIIAKNGLSQSDVASKIGITPNIYSVGAVGIPMLTHYFFGNENYARTYSFIGFLTNVGSASSLTLIGYLYDFTQSYQMVFIIALCFHLINLILLVVICLRYNGVGDK